MMGLQATATKRKLEDGGEDADPEWGPAAQAKVGRADDWGVDSTSAALATSLLSEAADDSDEEDEEDDVEEGGEAYLPAGRGYQLGYSAQYDQGYQYRGYHRGYWGAQGPPGPPGQSYYRSDATVPPPPPQTPPPQPVQTIRCEENGKSYLDLGSSYTVPSPSSPRSPPTKCCDGSRTSWCSRGPASGGPGACYRQRRLAVLNLSMCKLGRYRQFSDPSLRRSVLICNTLRLLEREMEQDGCFFSGPAHGPPLGPPPQAAREPSGPLPCPGPLPHHQQPQPVPPPYPQFEVQPLGMPVTGHGYPATPYRVPEPTAYEQSFRELTTPLRPTPFPSPAHPGCDADSGLGDDDSTRSINWGSVLSLSSQSDLDPLNNNELFPASPSSTASASPPSPAHSSDSLGLLADEELGHEFDDFLPSWKLTPLSADDLLKSVPCSNAANAAAHTHAGEGELDSIMHVLVGT